MNRLYQVGRWATGHTLHHSEESYRGTHNIPEGKGILAANHRHWRDIFLIAQLTDRQVHYVAKKELFEQPFLSWFLPSVGTIPVDRTAGMEGFLSAAGLALENDELVCIFPEGTRSQGNYVRPFRPGVAQLAIKYDAPIIPVGLYNTEGNEDIGVGVLADVGRPITPRNESPRHLAERVRTEVARLSGYTAPYR